MYVLFYMKLKSDAGRQFLKFSGHFTIKSLLTSFLNFLSNEFS